MRKQEEGGKRDHGESSWQPTESCDSSLQLPTSPVPATKPRQLCVSLCKLDFLSQVSHVLISVLLQHMNLYPVLMTVALLKQWISMVGLVYMYVIVF